jgi:hypothetical protein
MDWVKIGAIVGCGLGGIQAMRNVFSRWARIPPGITVHNGEYKQLVSVLSQIATTTNQLAQGQVLMVAEIGALSTRVSKLECRFPTQGDQTDPCN